jgi:uncharacterized membrane protein
MILGSMHHRTGEHREPAGPHQGQQVSGQEAEDEEPPTLGHDLGKVLEVTAGLGMILIIAGSIIAVVTLGRLPTMTVPIGALPTFVLRLDPVGILTLGLLLLIAGPAIGLVYLIPAFLRTPDRLYALVALLVLMILVGSIFVTTALRGG